MTLTQAQARLSANGVKYSPTNKTVNIIGNYGIKVWAAIDCLLNHHGYTRA